MRVIDGFAPKPIPVRDRCFKGLWSARCALAVIAGLLLAIVETPAARGAESPRLVYLGPLGPVLVGVRTAVGVGRIAEARTEHARQLLAALDEDGNGSLDAEEAGRIPRAGLLRVDAAALGDDWRQWDQSPTDGVLSVEELTAYLKSLQGPPLTIERRARRLAESVRLDGLLDRNGDGRIDADEVRQGLDALRAFDFDDDDALSVAELQPFPLSVVQAQQRQAAAEEPAPVVLLSDVDALTASADRCCKLYGGADGWRWENSPALSAAVFRRFDANRDGLWDRDEARAFLAEQAVEDEWLVSLSPPRVVLRSAPRSREGRPVVTLAGVDVTLSARDYSWQALDRVKLYKLRFRQTDTAREGTIGPDQFGGLEIADASFADLDLNGDGRLTLAEMELYFTQTGLAQQGKLLLTYSEESSTLFDLLDADLDKRLKPREFVVGAQRLLEEFRGVFVRDLGPVAVRRTLTFSQPEILDTAPTTAMMMNTQNRQGIVQESTAGPEWFRRMDFNRDGDVSWREFAGSRAQFEVLDRNGDGWIDAEEAALAPRRTEQNQN